MQVGLVAVLCVRLSGSFGKENWGQKFQAEVWSLALMKECAGNGTEWELI